MPHPFMDVSRRPLCPVCGQPMRWISHRIDRDLVDHTSVFRCEDHDVTCTFVWPYEISDRELGE